MSEWVVQIDFKGSVDPDAALDWLQGMHPALSVGHGRVGATLSVNADTHVDAIGKALHAIQDAPPQAKVKIEGILHVGATTWSEAERQLEIDPIPPLVGLVEIAEALGVSRARAHQIVRKAGFPQPLTESRAGRLWLKSSVTAWMARTGRVAS